MLSVYREHQRTIKILKVSITLKVSDIILEALKKKLNLYHLESNLFNHTRYFSFTRGTIWSDSGVLTITLLVFKWQ